LRARHDRPRGRRAAEQRDELAALHSITSSASASSKRKYARESNAAHHVIGWPREVVPPAQ
jgi:hypothetical protein